MSQSYNEIPRNVATPSIVESLKDILRDLATQISHDMEEERIHHKKHELHCHQFEDPKRTGLLHLIFGNDDTHHTHSNGSIIDQIENGPLKLKILGKHNKYPRNEILLEIAMESCRTFQRLLLKC
jgi:hypothetical protein